MDFTEYAAHHLVDNPHTGGHRPITAIDTLLVYIRRNRTHPSCRISNKDSRSMEPKGLHSS